MAVEKQTEQTFKKVYRVVVVGGGAAGLFFAAKYGDEDVLVLERNDRLGKKVSATGGGWGNVTNVFADKKEDAYFTLEREEKGKIFAAVRAYPPESLQGFLQDLGCVTICDERGRVYPASRQASSLNDCLRAEMARRGVCVLTEETAEGVREVKRGEKTLVEVKTQNGVFYGENVLLCVGGCAAKNFGSDGNGYSIARAFGHERTPVFPSLVQLKCEGKDVKTLKGIRAFDCAATLLYREKPLASEYGDVLFTEFGVSGDCVFRLSAYLPYESGENGRYEDIFSDGKVELSVDFLPNTEKDALRELLSKKRERYKNQPVSELFAGIVNNQIGRKIVSRAEETYGSIERKSAREIAKILARLAKDYRLTVRGTLGFDNAQVTKGGLKLSQTDGDFRSVFLKNVYFAGEILDVDGACGGFNLQWAYSSACVAGESMKKSAREQSV